MQAAESEHPDLELDPLWNSKPVEFTQQRGDVVKLSRGKDHTCNGIHHRLYIKSTAWQSN